MTNLSPVALQALQELRQRDAEYRRRKAEIETELKLELTRRLETLRQERNNALVVAAQAGVPRTQLGKAIGTSNYKTVQDILAETAPVATAGGSDWSLLKSPTEDTYIIQANNIGAAKVSGSAKVTIKDGDIDFVEGDEFVLPIVYREGIAGDIIGLATRATTN